MEIWPRAPYFHFFINWGHSLIGGTDYITVYQKTSSPFSGAAIKHFTGPRADSASLLCGPAVLSSKLDEYSIVSPNGDPESLYVLTPPFDQPGHEFNHVSFMPACWRCKHYLLAARD